jgi:hypothetical protein
MKAVYLALDHWHDQVRGQSVLIATDNSTVVSYINKQGGTSSIRLCRMAKSLLLKCHSLGIKCRSRHIPGKRNVIADALSRQGQIVGTEWSLNKEVFQTVCNVWYTPQIDLFATRFNNKVTTFVSPVPDPLAWAVDAMTTPWTGMWAYAYPPSAMIGPILTKVQREECQLILIAPLWPQAPWFVALLELLVDLPRSLPE